VNTEKAADKEMGLQISFLKTNMRVKHYGQISAIFVRRYIGKLPGLEIWNEG
jgi:hypothetical protein